METARALGLKVIPVINKIDLLIARVEETKKKSWKLSVVAKTKFWPSLGKTGEGVNQLLEEITCAFPAPKYEYDNRPRALIFDFEYPEHQGMIVYVRVTDGVIKKEMG